MTVLAHIRVHLQNSVKVHMRKHNGEKLNESSQFGSALYDNGSIQIHMITHDEDNPNI